MVFDRHLRPHGIRSTQFITLVTLMLRGGTPITVLAKTLGMDRTTLTRNVALLESKGWVQIQPGDEDARAHVVSATESGRSLVRAALPAWRMAQTSVAEVFGPTGVAALHQLAETAMP